MPRVSQLGSQECERPGQWLVVASAAASSAQVEQSHCVLVVRACFCSDWGGQVIDRCHCRFDLAPSFQFDEMVVFPQHRPRVGCRLSARDGPRPPCSGSYPSLFSIPKATQ